MLHFETRNGESDTRQRTVPVDLRRRYLVLIWNYIFNGNYAEREKTVWQTKWRILWNSCCWIWLRNNWPKYVERERERKSHFPWLQQFGLKESFAENSIRSIEHLAASICVLKVNSISGVLCYRAIRSEQSNTHTHDVCQTVCVFVWTLDKILLHVCTLCARKYLWNRINYRIFVPTEKLCLLHIPLTESGPHSCSDHIAAGKVWSRSGQIIRCWLLLLFPPHMSTFLWRR